MALFKVNSEITDDYMTPKYAWEQIAHLIQNRGVLWEPFYGDGTSGDHLRELGLEVIHENEDFFENDRGDIIVTNPPFSQAKKVLERLKELGKPFVIILPSSKINTQYFRSQFQNEIQLIIPPKRIQFIRFKNGVSAPTKSGAANFDCFYYCWKMNFERDLNWID